MTGAKNLEFVNGHTYDISGNDAANEFDETTLNTGIQKALGDNKSKLLCILLWLQELRTKNLLDT